MLDSVLGKDCSPCSACEAQACGAYDADGGASTKAAREAAVNANGHPGRDHEWRRAGCAGPPIAAAAVFVPREHADGAHGERDHLQGVLVMRGPQVEVGGCLRSRAARSHL